MNVPTWTFLLILGIILIYVGKRDINKGKKEGSSSAFGYSTNVSLIVLGIALLIGAFFRLIGA